MAKILSNSDSTDGLDGYLARVMDWQTDLGKILDPIADKVLLIGTIFILWMNFNSIGYRKWRIHGFCWTKWLWKIYTIENDSWT